MRGSLELHGHSGRLKPNPLRIRFKRQPLRNLFPRWEEVVGLPKPAAQPEMNDALKNPFLSDRGLAPDILTDEPVYIRVRNLGGKGSDLDCECHPPRPGRITFWKKLLLPDFSGKRKLSHFLHTSASKPSFGPALFQFGEAGV